MLYGANRLLSVATGLGKESQQMPLFLTRSVYAKVVNVTSPFSFPADRNEVGQMQEGKCFD